jgi:thymidylate synthase
MPHFRFDSAAEALYDLVEDIPGLGREVSPRGQKTYELRGVTIEIMNPYDCLCVGMGRRINTKLAALEALQLIGGFSDPLLMAKASPATVAYLDDGEFRGAYGPRIWTQMDDAINRLRDDPDSRQSIVQIWDPERDLHDKHKDLPCTVYLSFYIRDGRFCMHTHMRSNDIWLGFTYDVVQFSQLQASIANFLDLEIGSYMHYADSLHLYDRDLAKAHELTQPLSGDPNRLRLYGISCDSEYEDYTDGVGKNARDLAYLNYQAAPLEIPTETEQWFMRQMKSVHGK